MAPKTLVATPLPLSHNFLSLRLHVFMAIALQLIYILPNIKDDIRLCFHEALTPPPLTNVKMSATVTECFIFLIISTSYSKYSIYRVLQWKNVGGLHAQSRFLMWPQAKTNCPPLMYSLLITTQTFKQNKNPLILSGKYRSSQTIEIVP